MFHFPSFQASVHINLNLPSAQKALSAAHCHFVEVLDLESRSKMRKAGVADGDAIVTVAGKAFDNIHEFVKLARQDTDLEIEVVSCFLHATSSSTPFWDGSVV